MIKNYFKTAWRNLWNNRFYSSINLFGLAIGLAVGLIILLWVKDELSYDRFHANAPQTYRVVANLGTGSSKQSWGGVPAPIGVYGKNQVPEIKESVRIVDNWDYAVFQYGDNQFKATKAAYIDPAFFSLFNFTVLSGNKAKLFPDNNSILLTSSTAQKYFGNEDPIGKVIKADNKENFTVRGVIADFPDNSSIQYDMLFPIERYAQKYVGDDFWKSMDGDWGNYYALTFIQITPGTSTAAIEKKLTDIQHKHHPDSENTTYTLQPLNKMHLYAPDGSSSSMQMVRIFFVVAILLLLIACINYVNLSTARSMLRAKEVSVRKIIGAAKLQLFLQFIVETIILFVLATLLAIVLIYALLPFYNTLSGKNSSFQLLDAGVWSTIGITILGTLIASSIYPALLLSSFKPILALKGKVGMGIGSTRFRQVLVVTQFSFSVILIIGTLIIGSQMRFIRDKELGFDKTHIFTVNMRDMEQHYDAVKAELLQQPGITGITSANSNIIQLSSTTGDTDWEGKDPNSSFMIHPMAIDAQFIPQLKLEFVAGQNFRGDKADSSRIILNETAVREAGIKDPIGKWFQLWDVKAQIIGVVKDFHSASLKNKIEPVGFLHQQANYLMYVKTNGKDAAKAIAAVEKKYKQYNAGFPFEYRFLDDTYDRLYRSDQRTSKLFNVFAGIAIIISCLGLFGLATYTAQVKTREIGIRKVLGASVAAVTTLLAKDFMKLVLIAIVIATPLAWLAMEKWLQDFAYRTSINPVVFILAGIIALIIALATVSSQAIRAALTNPVKSLKSNE
jgi:putative ABC transport system permease protein